MNLEERLQAMVSQAETDGAKLHDIVQGDVNTVISLESGTVPSVAKQMKDVHDEVVNGVIDYMTSCKQARDETLQAKTETLNIKNDTNTIKSQILALKNETETFKEQANMVFNNISDSVSTGITNVQNETKKQISVLQAKGKEQVDLAKAQADRAESATSTKLNINCSNLNIASLLSSLGLASNNESTVLKFPIRLYNGKIRTIIIQFGKVTVPADNQVSFKFPEKFPSVVISTQATFYTAFYTGSDAGCGIHDVTLTGGIAENGGNWTLGIGWVAIGY